MDSDEEEMQRIIKESKAYEDDSDEESKKDQEMSEGDEEEDQEMDEDEDMS